ncbi:MULTISPECIES: RHS repeat-associated core domain-containing protein [Pseudomonas]|uniref:RHS repeat-associated core domain-containing protein n=2 Tax=Pseudomonas TaxID=286 RepID=A0ABM6J466_9PSED|nr:MULTISPECIES: RHS repeat-associated core domain-containing protein [Pseudomonas]MBF8638074.1 RHS repeat-associated core domain-containing protein [Pseudomonas fulva]AQW69245.1 hypothetical protein B2J77_13940 [Pseudomonas parafulva]MBF8689914.1 RHS repeat-associated core domain-containing protein [Pseudomonas fulva]MBF8766624.1 RHS repeat-associated core domain-containing protein [Pseudomonas putida]MBH3345056.1 RHS repeat-associated core domain-containing protein [Pseudomonas parafulva]
MHIPTSALSTYTPYGHSLWSKSSLGFNGEFSDPISRLYPLGKGHRLYDPTLMRLQSPDHWSPFAQGGLNPYAYCQNDPVNMADPSGRAPVTFSAIKKWWRSNHELAAESLGLTRKSISPNPQSIPSFNGGRAVIHEYTRKLSTSTPFIHKLGVVNSNLASHGDNSLSIEHAQVYVDIADRTRRASISNTSAHLLASQEWMKERGAPRLVGTSFNLLGALAAGAEDHALFRTGKSLAYMQQSIRTETT